MLPRTTSLWVGIALIAAVGIGVHEDAQSKRNNSTQVPGQTQMAGGITRAQVAIHNSDASCWSVINGNVYDLTSWIPNHPGGEQRILRMCGTDGSDAYNGKHGGESRPATILSGFKLGAVAQ